MTDKKRTLLFTASAYVFFLIAFGLIGAVILPMGDDALHFQQSPLMQLMVAVAAWTPTFALLVFFKKLLPNTSVKAFFKHAFQARLNVGLLLCITAIQLAAFFGAVGITAAIEGVTLQSLLHISLPTLATGFAFTAIQGPTGEQAGWRGFLQPHLQKRHSVLKSSIFVGLIWGFWHAPLWFTGGFAGLDLILYIVFYMIAITCAAIIIGVCYHHCNNLFVPIWIHFMFNFTLTMFTGNVLAVMPWLAAVYLVITIGYVIWHKRRHAA